MNQNLNDMMAMLCLGQMLGKLGLIRNNNEEWCVYEARCKDQMHRSVKEYETMNGGSNGN